MNLKIEDLEKEMSVKKGGPVHEAGSNDMNSSGYSITSSSFVHASMKEALQQHGNTIDTQKGSMGKDKGFGNTEEPPKEYEKML